MASTLTYQQLFQLYRNEKETNALGKLPDEFEESLSFLVSSLNKKAEYEENVRKELENAKKIASSLMELRRRKLVLRAISNNEEGKIDGINGREEKFFENIREICGKEERWVESTVGEGRREGDEPAKKIKMMKDVPEYKGSDGKDYGPYSQGETVELAEKEAEWMVDRKMAGWVENPNKKPSAPSNGVIYVTKAVKLLKMYMEYDIPEYENTEGEKYGPYKKGDIVELPEPEARYLIRRKLADIVVEE
ncbi:MAG: hypothetical protein ABIH83_00935 [Candidatus Micrarchaeota archaeon]